VKKVIRDGNVAVLFSPGYGAGWYTWHNQEELIYHPTLIEMVEQNRQSEITEELCRTLVTNFDENDYIYVGGAEDLRIEWMPVGTQFQVNEYDGNESIQKRDTTDWYTA
jgi:hypothetical protein